MTKKKALRYGLSALLIAGLLLGGNALLKVKQYKAEVAAMEIGTIKPAEIPDGTYTGACDVGLVQAKVAVTVKQGRLEAIELLEHKNGKGAAAEVVPERVIAAQSLSVDTVSGATSSSKVILKAIENALTAQEGSPDGGQ